MPSGNAVGVSAGVVGVTTAASIVMGITVVDVAVFASVTVQLTAFASGPATVGVPEIRTPVPLGVTVRPVGGVPLHVTV